MNFKVSMHLILFTFSVSAGAAQPAGDADATSSQDSPPSDSEEDDESPDAAPEAAEGDSQRGGTEPSQVPNIGSGASGVEEVPSREAEPSPDGEPQVAEQEPADTSETVDSRQDLDDVDLSDYLPRGGSIRPSVSVGAFADFGYYFHDSFETSELRVGQLVFHSTARLSEQFATFAEVSLDSVPTPSVHVHRLLFQWESSDSLKVAVGRYHLPLTWWNATVHHGLWLQTTATRPGFLDFSASVLPNHAEGVFIQGQLPALRQLGVRYELGLSGGSADHNHGATEDDVAATGMFGTLGSNRPSQSTEEVHEHAHDHEQSSVRLTVNGVLAIEPRAIPHLRVGVSGLRGPHDQEMPTGHTQIAGAHMAYTSERPEVIVEGVVVSNDFESDDGEDETHQTWATYAQAGYRLHAMGERIKPYARYEYLVNDIEDPAMAAFQSYAHLCGGTRVDLTPTLALKVELGRYLAPTEVQDWGGAVQLSATW